MWWHQSLPSQGGRVRSRGMRDGIRALPNREAGSGTVGRVAAHGRTTCPLSQLKLVRRGTQSIGYTIFPKIDEQDKVM
jgi:hypothetical protein